MLCLTSVRCRILIRSFFAGWPERPLHSSAGVLPPLHCTLGRALQQRKRPGEQLASPGGGAAMSLAGTAVRLPPAACETLLRRGAAAAFEGLLAAALAAPGKLGLRGFMCAPDVARACMMGLQVLAAKGSGGGRAHVIGTGCGSGGRERVEGGSSVDWAALRARLLPALRGCKLPELQDDVAGLLQGLAAAAERAESSQRAAANCGEALLRPRSADGATKGSPLAVSGRRNGANTATSGLTQVCFTMALQIALQTTWSSTVAVFFK